MHVCNDLIMELFLVEKSSSDIHYLQWEEGEDGIRDGLPEHMALDIDTQE